MSVEKKKVAVVGSGNWGSAIARIIGRNVTRFDYFDDTVKMFVYEEMVDGEKLSKIINNQNENVKYLPGYKFTPNVVAVPDVLETCKDADILIFVIPHKFISTMCKPLVGQIKSSAIGISLIKGFDTNPDGSIELISNLVHKMLNIEMGVLMGANLAGEVAAEKFCETTIACKDNSMGKLLKDLIQTENFRVTVVNDVSTVELCGALKNIVACGAGFVDGLGYGDNTKAAIIRLGLMEMIHFAQTFYPGAQQSTFFESCGVADLITTCYGGRNRRVAEAFVKTGKTIDELEKEMLNGQKMQGQQTAEEVYHMLHARAMEDRFPLFVAVHRICKGELPPTEFVECIRKHPEHF